LQYVEGVVNLYNSIHIFLLSFLFDSFTFQKNIEAAREAYDAFLELYPYCYGYWRKYADYERKHGTKEDCEKVSKYLSYSIMSVLI